MRNGKYRQAWGTPCYNAYASDLLKSGPAELERNVIDTELHRSGDFNVLLTMIDVMLKFEYYLYSIYDVGRLLC